MVTLVQHLQSAHLNETKSNNEEAPYLTTKSSKDHVAEPRADLNPCNSIPTIEASRFTMYQGLSKPLLPSQSGYKGTHLLHAQAGNISRIDQWNRTAFHPNYRFIIEAIAAYYEVYNSLVIRRLPSQITSILVHLGDPLCSTPLYLLLKEWLAFTRKIRQHPFLVPSLCLDVSQVALARAYHQHSPCSQEWWQLVCKSSSDQKIPNTIKACNLV